MSAPTQLEIPARVRLVTLEEQTRLEELRAKITYNPCAGFLKDRPINPDIPARIYRVGPRD